MGDPAAMVAAGEVEFDRALDAMSMQDLVNVITHIQSEIVSEQSNFQQLHQQLATMTDLRSADESAAHRHISQELVECQDKIGMLMQKNIKCFKASSSKAASLDDPQPTTNGTSQSTSTPDASAKNPVVDSIPTGGTVKKLRSTVWHQAATPEHVRAGSPARPLAATSLTTRRSQQSLNTLNGGVGESNGGAEEGVKKNGCSGDGVDGVNGQTEVRKSTLRMPRLSNGTMHYVEHREVTDISGNECGEDELVTAFDERPSLLNWNPSPVLEDLYRVEMDPRARDDLSRHYVLMEGYLEKLPMNTKEASVLKVWKRRFCKAERGNLFYFKEKQDTKSLGFIQLMGAVVTDIGQRMLQIDDQRGHVLTLRCISEREHVDWLVALQSQTIDDTPDTYIRPVLNPEPHPHRNVVIIDIGGCSVRAGLLGNMPSLPSVFFPFVVAVDKKSGEQVYGVDAFRPDVRARSRLIYPMKHSARLDKVNISGAILSGILDQVFSMLHIDPSQYTVMLSTANRLTSQSLQELMTSLFSVHSCRAVCMMYQSVLSLYSYSSVLGVVVDLGERCDIVPVIDGYVMSGNSSNQPYGGGTVSERLSQNLAEHKHRFYTETEKLLTRLAKEKYCYVSEDHDSDMNRFYKEKSAFLKTIPLSKYYLPTNAFSEISVDSGTFHAPEGLFDPGLWGQDTPALHKATHKVIQQCPVDARKDLCRNIYLSGGTTLLPGLKERLESELQALFKSQSVQVKVHASPYRYHAAYIGACVLAMLEDFPSACVTPQQWRNDRGAAIRRLQMV